MYSRTNLKTWLVILVVLLAVLPGSVRATGTYDDGDGSAGEPFQINTPAQMDEIGQHPEDWGLCFILTADIDLAGYTGTAFHIIGTDYDNPFTGVFDGNDHTISNFSYTSTDTRSIGLFGWVGTDGEIKNLGMVDVNVDAGTGYYVGGLVGSNFLGVVSNCYATGSVTGDDYGGGLVGINIEGTISNCYATGTVTGTGGYVGGLVGWNAGTVSNCYARGNVTGDGGVGGLAGVNGGTVSNCYATGSVSGINNVGGLLGGNSGMVSNCYATGNVTGTDWSVGGLVGYNHYSTITNCYATGSVSGDYYVGGLVGWNYEGDILASFWDTQTTGQGNGVGLNEGSGTVEVYGRTTAQMQTQSTFTDYGWDFVEVWDIGENQTYPYLRVYLAGNLNHDGRVDFEDFAIFADNWLAGM